MTITQTITRLNDPLPRAVPPNAIAVAMQAARDKLAAVDDQDYAIGPDLEHCQFYINRVLDESAKLKPTSQPYLFTDLLTEIEKTLQSVAQQSSRAQAEEREQKTALLRLGDVPPVVGLEEALLDSELRSVVRAMSAKQRVDLLAEMAEGRHARVLLATARSAFDEDVSIEARRHFRENSYPARRDAFRIQIGAAQARQRAAKTLIEAAGFARQVIELLIKAARHDEVKERTRQGAPAISVTGEVGRAPSEARFVSSEPRPSVIQPGNAVTIERAA